MDRNSCKLKAGLHWETRYHIITGCLSAPDSHFCSEGGLGGVLGAALAVFFMQLHKTLKRASHAVGLHEHKTPILSGRALLCIVFEGLLKQT